MSSVSSASCDAVVSALIQTEPTRARRNCGSIRALSDEDAKPIQAAEALSVTTEIS